MTDAGARGPEPVATFRRALPWSYVMTAARLGTTLLVSLVLARLLGPEAFGIIALANVLVLFLEMVVRQGLVAAIVQRPELPREHLDTAFWMTMGAVSLLLPGLLAVSGVWAAANSAPTLQPVLVALSPVLLLSGLSVVQEARLRRTMDFRALAIRTTIAVVAGGVAGLLAAALGAGVYALVIQQLATKTLEAVGLWRASSWRPRLHFELAVARDLLSFSGKTALAGVGVFVGQRADALLIGLFFGAVPVGLYRLALRFIDMTTDLAAGALQAVSLPELSRLSADREAFTRRSLELVRLGTVLTAPVLGVLAVASEPLMRVLGEEWLPAITPLRVLCLLAVFQLFTHFVGPILQAAGKPGVLAGLAWVFGIGSAAAFTLTGFLLTGATLSQQVTAIAVARLLFFGGLVLLVVVPVLHRVIGLDGRLVVRAMAPAVLAAGSGAMSVIAAMAVLGTSSLAPAAHLAVAAAAGGVTILSVTYLMEPFARGLVRRLLGSVRSSRPATDGATP
jgi:teichuronic acid exporter